MVEANRRKNTLAARVSRQRKKEALDSLVSEIASLKGELDGMREENEILKNRVEELEKEKD